jgi:hypothetical protein
MTAQKPSILCPDVLNYYEQKNVLLWNVISIERLTDKDITVPMLNETQNYEGIWNCGNIPPRILNFCTR